MKNRFYLLTILILWFVYRIRGYYYNGPVLIQKHVSGQIEQSLADWFGIPLKDRFVPYNSIPFKSFLKDEKERILEKRVGRERFLNMTMAQILTKKV